MADKPIDTTDQQAVKVAQETMTQPGYVVWHSSEEDGGPDVGITVGLGDGKMLWVGERSGREGDGMGLLVYGDKSIDANASLGEYDEIRDLIEHHVAPALSRLASVSSASADFVLVPRVPTEAMLIAARQIDISVEEDGDTAAYACGTEARRLWDAMLSESPEPVPATNQAGEVRTLLIRAGMHEDCDTAVGDVPYSVAARAVAAALATQPATSQEGEERAAIVSYIRRQSDRGADIGNEKPKGSTARAAFGGGSLALKRVADNIEAGEHVINDNAALATQPATSQEGEWSVNPRTPSVILTPHGRISINWSVQQAGEEVSYDLAEQTAAMIVSAVNSLAATPTPPTLSEDLRVILNTARQQVKSRDDMRTALGMIESVAAKALARAQVQAS
ncbi:hypothetical protein [Sphingomonas aerolata]|uniref:hypothetical protein n=1 Tax=Sphingomonas aerolata TaxID=185951 RepID=UPI00141A95FA|nr:hypothetical protein [Sphingomonas aerolata]NII59806.1 hypothetical protein [Sphingomonas aerolata]